MKYGFDCLLSTQSVGVVEFPEGLTWNDVEDWWVKWDMFVVKFKGDADYRELPLNSESDTDWKYPATVTVYKTDEDGEIDYSQEVAQRSES